MYTPPDDMVDNAAVRQLFSVHSFTRIIENYVCGEVLFCAFSSGQQASTLSRYSIDMDNISVSYSITIRNCTPRQ